MSFTYSCICCNCCICCFSFKQLSRVSKPPKKTNIASLPIKTSCIVEKYFPRFLSLILSIPLRHTTAHPINLGGLLIITSQESCKDLPGRLYTSLVDVGNRVHTRNDSDEDVRGNACNQAIALWFYLGLSLFKHSFYGKYSLPFTFRAYSFCSSIVHFTSFLCISIIMERPRKGFESIKKGAYHVGMHLLFYSTAKKPYVINLRPKRHCVP